MKVIDGQGSTWEVDEGLRVRATQLMKDPNFSDLISHVDLDTVIFIRLSNSKAKFHGKCYYFGKAPNSLISKFVVGKLSSMGVLNLDKLKNVDTDFFDLRYFIVINDDSIGMVEENADQVEDLALVHELMHIHPSGEKLIKHDIEDFVTLVDRFGAHWSEGIGLEGDAGTDYSGIPLPISGSMENLECEESD